MSINSDSEPLTLYDVVDAAMTQIEIRLNTTVELGYLSPEVIYLFTLCGGKRIFLNVDTFPDAQQLYRCAFSHLKSDPDEITFVMHTDAADKLAVCENMQQTLNQGGIESHIRYI